MYLVKVFKALSRINARDEYFNILRHVIQLLMRIFLVDSALKSSIIYFSIFEINCRHFKIIQLYYKIHSLY